MTSLTPTTRRPSRNLTLSMLALCGMSAGFAAETDPVPAPAPMINQDQGDSARRQVLAEAAYVEGMRARDQARLDDAVNALKQAVDYAPADESYRTALKQTEAMAGLTRESRSTAIDRLADELSVRQQELKSEALARLDDGSKAMEAGDYAEAERLFQQAAVRLETLPFAGDAPGSHLAGREPRPPRKSRTRTGQPSQPIGSR